MDKLGLSQKAIIFNQDKFLVIKRGETASSNPNKWDFPGGYVDFGEDLYDSIKREIQEEVGLKIAVLEPYEVHSRITYDKSYWVTIAYKCETDIIDIKLSYEHSEFKWVTLEEFNKLDVVDKIVMFANKAYD